MGEVVCFLSAAVGVASAAACGLLLRAARRERRSCGGMLAACREHRHDAKRFADKAGAALRLSSGVRLLDAEHGG